MKEKKLLKIQSLPKVLRMQVMYPISALDSDSDILDLMPESESESDVK
jgi:hypothetical protein